MDILNLWSLGHLLIWAFVGRYLLVDWHVFFVLSVAWEIVETFLPYALAREALENKISDLVVNTIGFYTGLKLRYVKDSGRKTS